MTLAAADIAQARAAAVAARRRVVDVLEESLGLEADAFTERLAQTLRLQTLPMAELRRMAPAFDLLPFAECAQHGCVLLRGRLAAAGAAIAEGRKLSESMEANGLTTPVAARMLAVGEQGGNIGEMLESIAAFHDEEMARWVDWFTRLFEPLLMAAIGLVIGAIVILMYMPIFELAGNLQ